MHLSFLRSLCRLCLLLLLLLPVGGRLEHADHLVACGVEERGGMLPHPHRQALQVALEVLNGRVGVLLDGHRNLQVPHVHRSTDAAREHEQCQDGDEDGAAEGGSARGLWRAQQRAAGILLRHARGLGRLGYRRHLSADRSVGHHRLFLGLLLCGVRGECGPGGLSALASLDGLAHVLGARRSSRGQLRLDQRPVLRVRLVAVLTLAR
mmetsp:Transcript_17188/g.48794  ORF Transcript_17188/g.48794 Transcript_17188/m.48794 type:complete len:208 (+) Transcript_17188:1125-1748(+)